MRVAGKGRGVGEGGCGGEDEGVGHFEDVMTDLKLWPR